jgi:hypothetical protein
MPTPTQTQKLEKLIYDYLTKDQGENAPKPVVTALSTVGTGHLRTSAGAGLPVSKATEYKQLAAYLVDRYLRGTRPSPSNNYLQQMSRYIAARLAGQTPSVPPQQIAALAALALGHVTDFMPPAARAVTAVKIAELYLAGI